MYIHSMILKYVFICKYMYKCSYMCIYDLNERIQRRGLGNIVMIIGLESA